MEGTMGPRNISCGFSAKTSCLGCESVTPKVLWIIWQLSSCLLAFFFVQKLSLNFCKVRKTEKRVLFHIFLVGLFVSSFEVVIKMDMFYGSGHEIAVKTNCEHNNDRNLCKGAKRKMNYENKKIRQTSRRHPDEIIFLHNTL